MIFPGAAPIVGGPIIMLAGVGIGNVVLPVALKLWLSRQIRLVSSIFASLVIGGSSIGALGTGILAHHHVDWRLSLGLWSLLPLVATGPWLLTLRADRNARYRKPRSEWFLAAISPHAWWMAVLFGMVFALAHARGASLLALLTVSGIPARLLIPVIVKWIGGRCTLPLLFGVTTSAGWLGTVVAPFAAPALWAVLIGIGLGAFAWSTSAVGGHTRTSEGAGALSSFGQGVGFAMAGIGPLGAVLLHHTTGGRALPGIVLVLMAVLLTVAGILVNRPWRIEDELAGGGANKS